MKKEIEKIKKEYQALSRKLEKREIVSDPEKVGPLSQKYSKFGKIIEQYEEFTKLQKEIKNTKELLADPDLAKEAAEEIKKLQDQKNKLKKILEKQLKPQNPEDQKDVIMEIRAGAGGNEAALFAADLFRMYSLYAQKQSWQINLLNSNRTGIGGFREIIFEINGENVFGRLKYESGVHRVQRIPKTEKSGRIHTSTASVAVLPQAEDIEIEIKPEDLRVDVYRSSGPGGQSVNTTDSAVRITHLPSKLTVSCQDQKSQLKNKEKALKILKTRLLEAKREEEAKAQGEKRRSQIGNADRSLKIRTYNFPQDRITDHRIKKSWFGIGRILDGNLDEVIQIVEKNSNLKT